MIFGVVAAAGAFGYLAWMKARHKEQGQQSHLASRWPPLEDGEHPVPNQIGIMQLQISWC